MAGIARNFQRVLNSNILVTRGCLTRQCILASQKINTTYSTSQTRSHSIWKRPEVFSQPAAWTRHYGASLLTQQIVEERVMLVLRLYDKINPETVTMDSHFLNDLGLDSLDHVEVVMAMEDEFSIEIPENDSERLMTPRDVYQYICDKKDIYD